VIATRTGALLFCFMLILTGGKFSMDSAGAHLSMQTSGGLGSGRCRRTATVFERLEIATGISRRRQSASSSLLFVSACLRSKLRNW
jgi:hypothetical protein